MFKRVFSLLFASMFFLSVTAFAVADIKVFAGMENKILSASGHLIQNDIHFAKDYSKTISDVYKNFVNNITVLFSLSDTSADVGTIKNFPKKVEIAKGILRNNLTENRIFLSGSRLGFTETKAFNKPPVISGLLIFMFILWYIGLLRLFSGASFSSIQIKT